MMDYYNPYFGQNIIGFFVQLMGRGWMFLRGELSTDLLAADEIQILVLIAVASSAGLLGTFLVLRKMTMLANALSHTILLGIVLAYVFTVGGVTAVQSESHDLINIQVMLIASLGMGLVTTFLTQFLNVQVGLQKDASIGLVFTSLFAVGVICATLLTRSAHIGTEVVMGNVDALQLGDCKIGFIIFGLNAILVLLFFKEYKVTTFDAGLSNALGISPFVFDYLLMTQVSATAIGAFRAVGVLMVLSFLTGPALIARMLTDHLKWMLWLAIGIGCLCAICGVAISRHLLTVYGMALSTAGIVVCLIGIVFFAVFLFKFVLQRKMTLSGVRE